MVALVRAERRRAGLGLREEGLDVEQEESEVALDGTARAEQRFRR